MEPQTSPFSLGIDIGTTKVAAAIVDAETREVIATASVAHESDVHGLMSGRSEQVVSRIESSLDRCIEALSEQHRRAVRAIGVTGQMHGVVLWNEGTDEASHLITWQDQRCLEGDFISKLRSSTGDSSAQTGYGTSTLAWLVEYAPEMLKRYTAAATIHDYLVSAISENPRPFTDPSDAASFGFFDISTAQWREECLAKARIPRSLLPEVRPAGKKVGVLSNGYASRWRMPAGIPIGNALGDNQASLYGSLTDPSNQISLTIGTGAQLSVVATHLPKGSLIPRERFEFRPYVGESYIAVAASLSGGRTLAGLGRALESFMRGLGLQDPPSLDAIQTAMHAQGLEKVATDLRAHASLSGERYDPSLRGGFTNLSFDNFTIGDMTAALSRGLVTSLRDALPKELLASRTEVVGSGNAIRRSPLMQQIIRETFGCTLKLQDGAETTACGAALLAYDSCC
ncbi:MAG: sedoheptulokinase [Pseudomonadota bacterium]|jgi:sedoheptulokinase